MGRNFDLGRKTQRRSPLKRFVIFTEGKNTEPTYFLALADALTKILVRIEVLGGEGDPKTLASKALDFKRGSTRGRRDISSYEKHDQVWIVFDRDEHPKVKETIDNCRASGVHVAYSNPCFEIWLILHLQEFDKSLDRHQVQAHLEKICEGYTAKGSKTPNCDVLIANLSLAEGRARAMRARRKDEGSDVGAPYTDVDLLTSALRGENAAGGF
jgi:hypothetical protein